MRNVVRILFLPFLFVAFGCGIQSCGDESVEAAAARETAETVVAYMSLETMFPDEKVRSLARFAGEGRTRELESVVSGGVDVNSRGKQNATPLFWSMRNLAGYRKLLDLGADPNLEFGLGESVMHWASTFDDTSFLGVALQHGGDPNLVVGPDRKTPLYEAALHGNTEALGMLLDAGADIDAMSSNDDTPVMAAAAVARFDVVYALLSRGANYRIENKQGSTLLTRIADTQRVINPDSEQGQWMRRVIEWLDAHGAEVTNQHRR